MASQWFNANGTGTLHWTGCRQLDGWQPRAGQKKEPPRARPAAAGGGDRAPPRPRPPPPAPGSTLPHGPFRAEPAPGAVPSRFQRLPPKSHLSPSSASSSPENRGDIGKASGNVPGRTGGHPLQARAPRKAWLCHNKVTTLINQPALIRGAPELRPNLTHHSCGSCGSLQRTFLLQQVTASLSPQALNTSLTNRVFSLQVTAQLTAEQGRTHKEPLLLLLLFKQMSNLRLTDHFLLSFSGAVASIWAPLLDSSCGSHYGCILQLLPPAFSCSSSARPSAPPSSQGPR